MAYTLDELLVFGPVLGPPGPGYGSYIGGGFTLDGMRIHAAMIPTVPTYYIYNLVGLNNSYYYENFEQESRYSKSSDSQKGMGDAFFNFLIPEIGNLPKQMGNLFGSTLSESEFNSLKTMALKNNVILQGMLGWGGVQDAMNEGQPMAVAINTQATMIAASASIAAIVGGGLRGQQL